MEFEQEERFRNETFPVPTLTGTGKIFINNMYVRAKRNVRKKDALITVCRNMDTMEKEVYIEESPKIPVYLYDGETPLTFLHKRMSKSKCKVKTVPYASKGKAIAKEVGLSELYKKFKDKGEYPGAIEKEIIKESKHIFGLDRDIHDVRKIDFYNKFPENRELKTFRKIVGDIEIDMQEYARRGMKIPGPMEACDNPIAQINIASVYHADINRVVLWVLDYAACATCKILSEGPAEIARLVKAKIQETTEYNMKNKHAERIKERIETMDMDVRIFKDEVEMIGNVFHHVHIECQADFCLFWNAAFDISYFKARYDFLTGGMAARDLSHPGIPEEFRDIIIKDSGNQYNHDTKQKERIWVEPQNRHDSFQISGKTVFMDSAALFFSLRATVRDMPQNGGLDTVLQHQVGLGKINLSKFGYTVLDVHHHDLILAIAYCAVDTVPLGYTEATNGDVDKAMAFTQSCRVENITSVVASTTGNITQSLAETDQVLGPNLNLNPFVALSEKETRMVTENFVDKDGNTAKRDVRKAWEEEQHEFYVGGLVADTSKNKIHGRVIEDFDILSMYNADANGFAFIDDEYEYENTYVPILNLDKAFMSTLACMYKIDPDREQEDTMDYDMKSEYPSVMCCFNTGEMTLVFRMRRVGDEWKVLDASARYSKTRDIIEAYTSRDLFTLFNEYFNFPSIKTILDRYMNEVLRCD